MKISSKSHNPNSLGKVSQMQRRTNSSNGKQRNNDARQDESDGQTITKKELRQAWAKVAKKINERNEKKLDVSKTIDVNLTEMSLSPRQDP